MKLIIGTANFLKQYGLMKTYVKKSEVFKIFKFIKDKKINNIDSAIIYDNFFKLKKKINFRNININTKIFFKDEDFKNNLFKKKYLKIIKDKININNLEKFETIFIHNFEKIRKKNYDKVFDFMNEIRSYKLTKKIGVSLYNPKYLKKIKKEYKLDIVQAPINLVDRRFLSANVKKIIKKKNLLLQARSIFLQGTLLNNYKSMKFFRLKKKNIFSDYNNWCIDNEIEKRTGCINFIKDQKIIHSVVIGVDSLTQCKQIYNDYVSRSKKNYPKKIFSMDKNLIDATKWQKN